MPGIRHVVTLTFKEGTTDEQVQAIREGLGRLPGAIPEIEQYEFGTDVGRSEGNASLAIVGDFASWADYETYRDHPVHREAIEIILPVVAARSAVQHERPGS